MGVYMIKIHKSATADTRSCDVSKVTKEQLLESSKQHIRDVMKGLHFLAEELMKSAMYHDFDKIQDIAGFYRDFVEGTEGFIEKPWYRNHLKLNRHHLQDPDGIPDDVNLLDVLEMIVDCVMAGMARTGEVYPLKINPGLLQLAFENTVALLKSHVEVVEGD